MTRRIALIGMALIGLMSSIAHAQNAMPGYNYYGPGRYVEMTTIPPKDCFEFVAKGYRSYRLRFSVATIRKLADADSVISDFFDGRLILASARSLVRFIEQLSSSESCAIVDSLQREHQIALAHLLDKGESEVTNLADQSRVMKLRVADYKPTTGHNLRDSRSFHVDGEVRGIFSASSR